MAATRKAGTTFAALAAMILMLSFLLVSFAASSEACGCKCCPFPEKPPTPAPVQSGGKCPVDALKLGVCADVLGGQTNLLGLGGSKEPCCELVAGLADLDAAICLCTAVKANVLGVVDLDLPVQLSLVVNHCGKKLPAGFQCTK